jgi:hypothetical protein
MTAFTPETPEDAASRIARLLLSFNLDDAGSVQLRLVGREVVMEGWVPSFEAKSKMEQAARAAGFRTLNTLRIIPGADSRPAADPSPSTAQPPI